MMTADYSESSDRNLIQQTESSSNPHAQIDRQYSRGKGKGRGKGFQRHGGSDFSRVQDYIMPEMFLDPWIDLYHRLSESVRQRETIHLSESDRTRVEDAVQRESVSKRANLAANPISY